ncbi:hypothetical protein [Paenibacillus anseongense]|uniref:hypothetical protein n=1 Tax=Paenibacillus anseongense TaxID=2682845 RepID=UPI002DBD6521|nr:hypothetical protein [Paenibacillus anseongense]MEC0269075.1 hypothetical protein [Paenibacillus anseongense]
MMIAEEKQFSMFPEASKTDIERARVQLSEYTKMMRVLVGFESNPPNTEINMLRKNEWSRICPLIQRAVDLIIEYDVREVTEYRFIKGNSRASTILRFSGLGYCEKTIDRKIYEGIKSVANSLLYLD